MQMQLQVQEIKTSQHWGGESSSPLILRMMVIIEAVGGRVKLSVLQRSKSETNNWMSKRSKSETNASVSIHPNCSRGVHG